MNRSTRYQQRPLITATEIGEFVYCAKAWQLKRDGVVADSPKLESGRAFHTRHGAQLALAGRLRQAGLAVALAGGLLLLVFLVWYFVRA